MTQFFYQIAITAICPIVALWLILDLVNRGDDVTMKRTQNPFNAAMIVAYLVTIVTMISIFVISLSQLIPMDKIAE